MLKAVTLHVSGVIQHKHISLAWMQPKAAPVWEGDAKLTFYDTSIDLGIAVFGRKVPAMPARADTPAEPAFVEIDSVIAFGEGYDIDIYDALSWADLQNISEAIMEAAK